jgi:hypothetical protein
MITMKAIRPKRFKSEAYKQYALEMARETANEVEKDFKATTKTWQHQPRFDKVYSVGNAIEILVGTNDDIYRYVDEGTKPHPIFAGIYTGKSNKKALAFQWGGKGSYRAKTKPGVIGSTGGGPTGPMVAFPYVQHPGTKPRKFSEIIKKKWEPRFKRRAEKLLKDFARASGHYAG